MRKLNRKYLRGTMVVIIIIFILFVASKNFSETSQKICINEKCFQVEIADSDEERRTGLSSRDFLKQDSGMLFIFPEENIPGFWMKDMKFPIDAIWINKNLEVIGIEKNMQPCIEFDCEVFYPKQKVKYVLEINSGLAENLGFEESDKIYFK